MTYRRGHVPAVLAVIALVTATIRAQNIGQEVSLPRHLQNGEEFTTPRRDVLRHGQRLFEAAWTTQEGGGRPNTKGTGAPLANASRPLVFPRAFNRVSAQDANSCAGCHNAPFGVPGGGGDFVTGVFVLAQRFDFITFDRLDAVLTGGSLQENGQEPTLQSIGNYRATLGMFGSGYVELLAREMTTDLQALRDGCGPGQTVPLVTKGLSFGSISRDALGNWDTSGVTGLPAPSLASPSAASPPNLVIRPFHQAGAVVSLRQFTNNAYNHHHGMQSAERFGAGVDQDGDGFVDELTRADITAVTAYQAAMAVPGRVIPDNPVIEAAILLGERRFEEIGCTSCHVPELPLDDTTFVEPNPFNPAGNLQPGQAPDFAFDLNSNQLPRPRLRARQGVTMVPAFTDFKLHDITSGPGDPNAESLDMQQPAGTPTFFAGNRKFITRKLWGVANEPPYFHHGQYTTLREAVLAHSGESLASRQAFQNLPAGERDAVIEFLKSLQVLPPGTPSLVVDEQGHPKTWPPDAGPHHGGHGPGHGSGGHGPGGH